MKVYTVRFVKSESEDKFPSLRIAARNIEAAISTARVCWWSDHQDTPDADREVDSVDVYCPIDDIAV